MTRFAVWALRATNVELDIGGTRTAMSAGDGGWFSVDVDAPPGTDYSFVLDGGMPLPDPRSACQAHGVHGPSRVVDHSAYSWTDAGWTPPSWESAVVYELHVGTVSPAGTFDGAIERLDHLVSLGVTHVEVMPVAQFSGEHGWGYDGVHLWAVHHAYGGPHGFKDFVDACHARGLAVLLDVVYNHLGPAGNYLSQFGPYFTAKYHTPWGDAVNYDDDDSAEVRVFVIANAQMWLRDYHVDGLRLDAVHAIHDDSPMHVLEELGSRVEALSQELARELVLVAESDLNDPRVIRDRASGGFGMTAQWSDDLHHALHSVLAGERAGYYEDFGTVAQIAAALSEGFVYAGQHSAHRGRPHGQPLSGLPAYRLVGYLQNHDQIGNRARGDRSSQLMSDGLLRVGAALVLLGPSVPMLFQGEEWGAATPFQYFTAHEDPELAEAVRRGRQGEFDAFGWRPEDVPDPQARETFECSRLDWTEIARPPHASLLDWHRALIALRHAEPDLRSPSWPKVSFDATARWLVLERGHWQVCANLSSSLQRLPGSGEIVLASAPKISVDGSAVLLAPESVAVLHSG
ncbi:MAG: malto-oligosyltrehalose trehalohydrolase [Mycobacteriales bacterium]